MKIVLLGASGQLGQEWQKVIDDRHENILLLPYSSSDLDITHHSEVSKELHNQQPEVVINCAAYTDVDGAEEDKEQARLVNAEAVAGLAELSQDLGFKLVHYSTDYVFPGNKKDHHKFPQGYPEDHSADPINWYGQTKWEGEQTIRQMTDNYIIVRLSWLCGQFGGNFIKTMLKLGQERDTLQVVDDQWGSPTFTENVVINTLRMLKSESTGTFHITTEGVITWYDFARAIFELKDIDVSVDAVSSDAFPTKAERPRFSKLSTKKLKAVEGAKLVDWKEGLENLLKKLDK